MFVSSYSTYINTNSSQKTAKNSEGKNQESSKLFSSKLASSSPKVLLTNSNKPVNYISLGNAQYNKELIRSQQENIKNSSENNFKKASESTQKFAQTNTLNSAKAAYTENSSMFSFLRKPQPSLEQTPKISQDLPKDIQELKEQNIRHTMVNTYISNDNYYRVTA